MDIPVVELRRYTLKPGRRDEMIDAFERHLMESQEETGMWVLGTFRDMDQPDHFVWLRGFPDMESRKESLTAFYSGPVWKEYGPLVRPTMIDTDDVHLLRPVGPGLTRRPFGSDESSDIIYVVFGEAPDAFATFVTEKAENTYPALPVNEGVDVTVALTRTKPPGDAARLIPTRRSALR